MPSAEAEIAGRTAMSHFSDTGTGPSVAERQAAVSLGELEHVAGLALRLAQLAVIERLFACLELGEMRLSELTVLHAVSRNPDIRQGVLADLLEIKWPNMTKLVRSLEKGGLIERHVPPDDRRSVALRATPEGVRRADAFVGTLKAGDREALAMLDDEEYARLLELCRKIAGRGAGA